MTTISRYNALELAIRAHGTKPAAEIVQSAQTFYDFISADAVASPASPAGDAPIETSEADAKPPKAETKKAPAKTTTPPATDKKPAGNVKAAEEPKAETPAAKTETPAAAKAATGVTMTQVQQAVVKLVTKIGRDGAVAYMQKNFGSPNVSGLDTAKYSYDDVFNKVSARIKEADAPAEA